MDESGEITTNDFLVSFRYDLSDVNTYDLLEKSGIDFNAYIYQVLLNAAQQNFIDVLYYFSYKTTIS